MKLRRLVVMILACFTLPFLSSASAGLNYPDSVVNFTYDYTYKAYKANGSGSSSDLDLIIMPTADLNTNDTITVWPKITVTDGQISPFFRIGWDQSAMTFMNVYSAPSNDSVHISGAETYNSDGNIVKTWYFSDTLDSNTHLHDGDIASYWIDLKWNQDEDSMYVMNNEIENMYGEDWTFVSGWNEGSSNYHLGEVASQDTAWFLGDNLNTLRKLNVNEGGKNIDSEMIEREQGLLEIKQGKRKPLDYMVKVYNAEGELVIETTESNLKKNRKKIEKMYNLVP